MERHIIVKEQRRKIIIVSLIVIFIMALMNITKLTGHQGLLFRTISLVYLIISSISLFVFLYFKLKSSVQIIVAILIGTELIICAEMLICAFENSQNSIVLLLTDMTMLSIILLVSLISYLRYTTYLLALITIICYTIAVYITDSQDLRNVHIIFIILFGAGSAFSFLLMTKINMLFRENIQFDLDKNELLSVFNITELELKAYIELSQRKDVGNRDKLNILNVLNDESHANILSNVSHIIEQEKVLYSKIGEVFPEFTKSEIEIAKLILEGKKLSDIIIILNKQRGNITCQRSNMRTKLNLNSKDNLRDALMNRISK